MDIDPEYYFNNTCIQLGITGNASDVPVYASINGCNRSTGAVEDPEQLTIMSVNFCYNFGPSLGSVLRSCAGWLMRPTQH